MRGNTTFWFTLTDEGSDIDAQFWKTLEGIRDEVQSQVNGVMKDHDLLYRYEDVAICKVDIT